MATSRVYPSWLPPNPRERTELTKLRRRQAMVIAWLIAMLPAGWIILAVTASGALIAALTIFWIALGVTFARQVTEQRCPRCHDWFCRRREPPYWYGLFNYRCESCGLSLKAGSTEL